MEFGLERGRERLDEDQNRGSFFGAVEPDDVWRLLDEDDEDDESGDSEVLFVPER